jgi:hypothetical protein
MKNIFFASLKSVKKGVGSGAGTDPDSEVRGTDPHQNVRDPQYWSLREFCACPATLILHVGLGSTLCRSSPV